MSKTTENVTTIFFGDVVDYLIGTGMKDKYEIQGTCK